MGKKGRKKKINQDSDQKKIRSRKGTKSQLIKEGKDHTRYDEKRSPKE